MKLRILLSIFFVIATTFSALHELEHTTNDADSSCLVYHINDNLSSSDIIDESKEIDTFQFEKISQNNQVLNLHVKNKSNPDRAPPIAS